MQIALITVSTILIIIVLALIGIYFRWRKTVNDFLKKL